MTMTDDQIEALEAYRANEKFWGFVLYARNDDKYWVSGEERWMKPEELVALAQERRESE